MKRYQMGRGIALSSVKAFGLGVRPAAKRAAQDRAALERPRTPCLELDWIRVGRHR